MIYKACSRRDDHQPHYHYGPVIRGKDHDERELCWCPGIGAPLRPLVFETRERKFRARGIERTENRALPAISDWWEQQAR